MCQRGGVTDVSAGGAGPDGRNEREPVRVLVVGEVLIDLLPRAPGGGAIPLEGRFGGSPANVAVGLARLGGPVGFAGRLARSGYGPWLRQHLQDEGIDLTASVPADEPCTLALVKLDESGTATYELYGPETADWAWKASELPAVASLAGGCVHTGSLATALPPGAGILSDWLRRLRRRGDVAISYDPNIRPTLLGGADLAEVVGPGLDCAHLVKVSEEDLAFLEPGATTDEVARKWLSGPWGHGPDLVVVTAGAAGATAWHRDGRRMEQSAPTAVVVDTVGAGDAFSAGLLSSLAAAGALSPGGLASIDDVTLAAALQRAVLVASITCTRAGADPPRRAELGGPDPADGAGASPSDLR
jgi:fructokinase